MKELSIEEKAKRYDEAIERAKNVLLDCTSEEQKVVEYITPEIKESEDERIRKELIDFVKSRLAGFPQCEKFIAWLEKQGEQKTLCDKCRKEHPSHSCQDITELGRCAVEHEQKPWSEEDDAMFNFIALILRNHQSDEDFTTFETTFKDCIDWLKSLKDKVLPQNITYYNPYKYVVESITAMVEKYAPFDSNLQDFYDNVKVKCKDAAEYDEKYPHNIWKPNDEQMEALEQVCGIVGSKYKTKVSEIYEQLKKLREE